MAKKKNAFGLVKFSIGKYMQRVAFPSTIEDKVLPTYKIESAIDIQFWHLTVNVFCCVCRDASGHNAFQAVIELLSVVRFHSRNTNAWSSAQAHTRQQDASQDQHMCTRDTFDVMKSEIILFYQEIYTGFFFTLFSVLLKYPVFCWCFLCMLFIKSTSKQQFMKTKKKTRDTNEERLSFMREQIRYFIIHFFYSMDQLLFCSEKKFTVSLSCPFSRHQWLFHPLISLVICHDQFRRW